MDEVLSQERRFTDNASDDLTDVKSAVSFVEKKLRKRKKAEEKKQRAPLGVA